MKKKQGTPQPGSKRTQKLTSESDVFQAILRDMKAVSESDANQLDVLSRVTGGLKTFDQLVVDTGMLDHDERDTMLRSYLQRRVEEMRAVLTGARVGSYHILEEVASGGMGIVFKARQESPMFTRDVAVKFMIAGSEAKGEDRERFTSEVKGLAGLSHPYLVSIYDSGIEKDLYYFTMEYVDGWALWEWPAKEEPTLERKVEVVRDVALALAYLHENGVVHRDVKPGNIMVDRSGVAKLLDFGIAQFSADPRRRVVQAGTPHYMGPEVIQPTGSFGPIGPASDVYALGAVLYWLLTGREVFEGEGDVAEIFERTLNESPRFPDGRENRLPVDLERTIARCLRKRVAERHATARELAADLDRYLRRRQRRTPYIALGGLCLALIVALAAIWSGADKPPPMPPPFNFSFQTYDEKVEQVANVDPSQAAPLRETLAALKAEITDWDSLRDNDSRLSAFNLDVQRFWEARVNEEEKRAIRAETYMIGAIPSEPSAEIVKLRDVARKTWRERPLLDASLEAYSWVKRAREQFEDVRRAQENEDAQRKVEAERSAAESAERILVETMESLNKRQLEYSREGTALRQEAEGLAVKAQDSFEARSYLAARDLWRKAAERAGEAAVMSNAAFQKKRDALRNRLEASRLARDDSSARLRPNLPGRTYVELERAIETAHAALKDGRLEDCETSLDQFDALHPRAIAGVARLEREAREAQNAAREALRPRRVPAQLASSFAAAAAAFRAGSKHFAARSYREASGAFDEALAAHAAAMKLAERMTRNMVWVEGGQPGGDKLVGFWIDRFEVSVGDYRRFLASVRTRGHGRCCVGKITGNHEPARWQARKSRRTWPVLGVSLEDAMAFARWRGKALPTRGMWRHAAKGGRTGVATAYPFGDVFDSRRINGRGAGDGFRGPAPVTALPESANALGCLHLSGNAAEWVRAEAGGSGYLMGGSYLTGEEQFLRVDHADHPEILSKRSMAYAAGFRCVLEAGEFGGVAE